MSKLILTLDEAFLGEFPLESKYLTIGRRPTNDIQIDNLAVSGEHARIITVDGESYLEDLDSTNGSLLNGTPLAGKHLLQHGDVISISKYKLRFVGEPAGAQTHGSQPGDFQNTIMVHPVVSPHPETSHAEPHHEPDIATGKSEHLSPARVLVLNGPGKGKEMELTKTLTTLGKTGQQVAVITRRPNGYFITHVEGASHPAVNGNAIGVQARQLRDNDVIELAGVKMEFYLTRN